MNWDPDELAAAGVIADELARFPVGRSTTCARGPVCMSILDAAGLVEGLHWPSSGALSAGTLAVRQICRLLGFDEHLPFRWRMDHKLVQALVLEHFCPGVVPVTRGLYRFFAEETDSIGRDTIRDRLSPYQVKRTEGYGATPDCAAEIDQAAGALSSRRAQRPAALIDEDWIVQEKISIAEEYRVHTVEDMVVEDLTYFRHNGRIVRGGREGPNRFVRTILDRLPNACVASSVCGWDIADTERGFRVIEVNPGGFYPAFRRGYRVSGDFSHSGGPVVVGRLIRHIESRYGIEVRVDCTGEDLLCLSDWYSAVDQWAEFFRISRRISRLLSGGEAGEEVREAIQNTHQMDRVRGTLQQVVRRLADTAALVD